MCTGYSDSLAGDEHMTIFQNLIYLVRDWGDDAELGERSGFFEKLVSCLCCVLGSMCKSIHNLQLPSLLSSQWVEMQSESVGTE